MACHENRLKLKLITIITSPKQEQFYIHAERLRTTGPKVHLKTYLRLLQFDTESLLHSRFHHMEYKYKERLHVHVNISFSLNRNEQHKTTFFNKTLILPLSSEPNILIIGT